MDITFQSCFFRARRPLVAYWSSALPSGIKGLRCTHREFPLGATLTFHRTRGRQVLITCSKPSPYVYNSNNPRTKTNDHPVPARCGTPVPPRPIAHSLGFENKYQGNTRTIETPQQIYFCSAKCRHERCRMRKQPQGPPSAVCRGLNCLSHNCSFSGHVYC